MAVNHVAAFIKEIKTNSSHTETKNIHQARSELKEVLTEQRKAPQCAGLQSCLFLCNQSLKAAMRGNNIVLTETREQNPGRLHDGECYRCLG